MCVLCGGYVTQVHWTDRKKDGKNDESTTKAVDNQRSRVRDRHIRTRLANKVLGMYGLKLRDWTGTKYILNDRKGRSEIIQDLGELWSVVDKLLGKTLDPLDPGLIQALLKQQESVKEGSIE